MMILELDKQNSIKLYKFLTRVLVTRVKNRKKNLFLKNKLCLVFQPNQNYGYKSSHLPEIRNPQKNENEITEFAIFVIVNEEISYKQTATRCDNMIAVESFCFLQSHEQKKKRNTK